jgi:hypothetical protein
MSTIRSVIQSRHGNEPDGIFVTSGTESAFRGVPNALELSASSFIGRFLFSSMRIARLNESKCRAQSLVIQFGPVVSVSRKSIPFSFDLFEECIHDSAITSSKRLGTCLTANDKPIKWVGL